VVTLSVGQWVTQVMRVSNTHTPPPPAVTDRTFPLIFSNSNISARHPRVIYRPTVSITTSRWRYGMWKWGIRNRLCLCSRHINKTVQFWKQKYLQLNYKIY